MCADPPEDVPALIRSLGDADVLVQEDAVCRLASLSRDMVEAAVLATLERATTPPLVQTNGARILRLFQLVRALGHGRGSTRERAVVDLSTLGAPARIILEHAVRRVAGDRQISTACPGVHLPRDHPRAGPAESRQS